MVAFCDTEGDTVTLDRQQLPAGFFDSTSKAWKDVMGESNWGDYGVFAPTMKNGENQVREEQEASMFHQEPDFIPAGSSAVSC